MESSGYIHDLMDIRILILYVTARVEIPVDLQTLYELCYVDHSLSYFDFCNVVPDLVDTGHLNCDAHGCYTITDKGRMNGSATEDSLALSVRLKAEKSVEDYRRNQQRNSMISTRIVARESGEYSVFLCLQDGVSSLINMELMAPNERQARHLERAFQKKAEIVYSQVMKTLLSDSEKREE